MDTLISNVTVVTMNPKMDVLFGAYIGIEDGKIVSIEKKAPESQPKTIIDGTGMVAIPGLINCHTHLATSVLRSFTDDLGNTEALQTLLQKEAKMDSRSAKAAALLSIAECLLAGKGAWRVHGGGFAGTTLNFVPNDMLDKFIEKMDSVFGKRACQVLDIRPEGAACLDL